MTITGELKIAKKEVAGNPNFKVVSNGEWSRDRKNRGLGVCRGCGGGLGEWLREEWRLNETQAKN